MASVRRLGTRSGIRLIELKLVNLGLREASSSWSWVVVVVFSSFHLFCHLAPYQ